MLDVMLLEWRQQRGALIGWSIAFIALAALTLGFYKFIGPEYEELFNSLPEGFADAFAGGADPSRPEGFIQVEFLSYIHLVYAVFAVSQGARALAGEEEAGTLGMLLAQPTTRWGLLLQKTAAGTLSILALCIASGVGLAIGAALGGVDVATWRLLLVGLDLFPATWAVYLLALAGSAWFHTRGRAMLPAIAYVVAAYFADLFSPLAPELESMKWISIYHLASRETPLLDGLDPVYWLGALGVGALLLVVAGLRFDSKDLEG